MTRDSVVWQVLFYGGTIAAALIEAVAVLAPADAASLGLTPELLARIRILYALVIGVSGKLGLSWLKKSGKDDDAGTGMGAKLLLWVVLLVTLAPLAACAPKTKTAVAKVDYGLYQAVKAIADTEVVLSRAGMLTPAQSLQINEALLPAAKLGLEGTQALRAWQPGQPLPPQIPALVTELGDISKIVIDLAAKPEAKSALLEKVALAQQALLAVLAIGGLV
jgi:hypothetical protein